MKLAASKVLLPAVFCLGILTVSTAQAASGTFGIKGGLSFSDQDWDYSETPDLIEPDHLTGVALGVFIDFPLTSFASLRPEALYVRKGNSMDFIRTNDFGEILGTDTYKDRIDYLSLLVTAKIKTPIKFVGDWYVLGGPRLDFKINTNSDMNSDEWNLIMDSYKDAVPGLTLGLGMDKQLGTSWGVLLEARYDLDLGNEMELNTSFNDIEIKSKSLMILAGITF